MSCAWRAWREQGGGGATLRLAGGRGQDRGRHGSAARRREGVGEGRLEGAREMEEVKRESGRG